LREKCGVPSVPPSQPSMFYEPLSLSSRVAPCEIAVAPCDLVSFLTSLLPARIRAFFEVGSTQPKSTSTVGTNTKHRITNSADCVFNMYAHRTGETVGNPRTDWVVPLARSQMGSPMRDKLSSVNVHELTAVRMCNILESIDSIFDLRIYLSISSSPTT
jgi:hypothetical protein